MESQQAFYINLFARIPNELRAIRTYVSFISLGIHKAFCVFVTDAFQMVLTICNITFSEQIFLDCSPLFVILFILHQNFYMMVQTCNDIHLSASIDNIWLQAELNLLLKHLK